MQGSIKKTFFFKYFNLLQIFQLLRYVGVSLPGWRSVTSVQLPGLICVEDCMQRQEIPVLNSHISRKLQCNFKTWHTEKQVTYAPIDWFVCYVIYSRTCNAHFFTKHLHLRHRALWVMLHWPPKLTPQPPIWLHDPKIDPVTPNWIFFLPDLRQVSVPSFKLIAVKRFRVMLQKLNLIFVTSVTFKIKVTTPKRIGFLRGPWGSYIPGFSLIAVILFELSCGNECLRTDRQMDSTIP